LKLERTFFILGTFFSFILSWDRFFFSSFGMMHGDPFSNRDNADRLVCLQAQPKGWKMLPPITANQKFEFFAPWFLAQKINRY
jgi:hypothetical protein